MCVRELDLVTRIGVEKPWSLLQQTLCIYIYVYSLRQKLCAGFTLKRYLFAAAYESKIKHHPY